ncbi:MAG: ABC transporter permease [Zavarzinia sp.]|nr:ABC transporter permease [Zavarzinia sp.]
MPDRGVAASSWRWGGLAAAPACALLALPIVVALLMARISLDPYTAESGQGSGWTIANWRVLWTDPAYLRSLALTARLTVITTITAVLLAYPLALFSRMASRRGVKAFVDLAVLVPLLTNLVLQIIGWMAVFSPANPLVRLLPFRIAFTEMSVVVVLIHHAVPFAYFGIDSALRNLPQSLEEAGATLGANRWQVLTRVIVPLSLPGVVAGSLLVAASAFSMYVIPILVGGYRVPALGVLVQGALDQSNWPLGATISTALTVFALAALGLYQASTRRITGQGGRP